MSELSVIWSGDIEMRSARLFLCVYLADISTKSSGAFLGGTACLGGDFTALSFRVSVK